MGPAIEAPPDAADEDSAADVSRRTHRQGDGTKEDLGPEPGNTHWNRYLETPEQQALIDQGRVETHDRGRHSARSNAACFFWGSSTDLGHLVRHRAHRAGPNPSDLVIQGSAVAATPLHASDSGLQHRCARVDRLVLEVVVQRIRPALAADAAVLHPAERRVGVDGVVARCVSVPRGSTHSPSMKNRVRSRSVRPLVRSTILHAMGRRSNMSPAQLLVL